MLQSLQIIQLGLFSLPVLSLLGLGLYLLAKPVSVIDRRWYLAIIAPLILANPLVILESAVGSEALTELGWRFWVVLIIDGFLLAGLTWQLRGFLVYGLSATKVEVVLLQALESKGLEVQSKLGVKNSLLGWGDTAHVLTVTVVGQAIDIWILDRFREVLIQADLKAGYRLLKRELSAIRTTDQPYQINAHIMGFLYIIFAIVLSVMMWILFFEPKLIQFD